MNLKEKLLELKNQYCLEFNKDMPDDINELLITVISKYQLLEPCMYLSEDDEWVNIVAVSLEDDSSQALSIKKSEITTFGIFNKDDIELNDEPQSEDYYQ